MTIAAPAWVAGVSCAACLAAAAAAAADCTTEVAALARMEAELPQLDLTPPIHHQLVCITLETLVDFARHVGDHVGRCPASALPPPTARCRCI